MPTIKIVNFTGEVPRLSARALGDNAQVSLNLLATSSEFRPLMADPVAGSASAGAQTLYRITTGGAFVSSPIPGTYVRSQLNDNPQERTYFSFDDGTGAPFEISTAGSRPLGIEPPSKRPEVERVVGKSFTRSDIERLIGTGKEPGELTSKILRGIDPIDGQTSDDNFAFARLQLAGGNRSGTLDGARLRFPVSEFSADFFPDSTGNTISIAAFPNWATVRSVDTLAAAIALIVTPESKRDPVPLFTGAESTEMAVTIANLFDPNGERIKAQRDSLDRVIEQFAKGCQELSAFVIDTTVTPFEGNPPDEFLRDEFSVPSRNPAYDDYLTQQKAYDAQQSTRGLEAQKKSLAGSSLVSSLKSLQSQASSLVEEIERTLSKIVERRFELVSEIARSYVNKKVLGSTLELDSEPVPDTRFYFYTYITDRGEESAPSPVSVLVEPTQHDSVKVSVTNPANPLIVGYRLYRSNTASNGAEFQLVSPVDKAKLTPAELAIAIYNGDVFDHFKFTPNPLQDSALSESLGEVCPTTTWLPPPKSKSGSFIRGFVNMPNGIVAGFIDNFVAFSEPYVPYAWPVEYQVTTDSKIVGLGAFGQSLLVSTESHPYIISGSDSASMSAERLSFPQPCLSLKSMVSTGDGVIYASPDGLCMVGSGGAQVITDALFSREDWQLLNPSSIIAAVHDRVYYFSYSGNGGGTYALDFVAKKLTRVDFKATAFYSEPKTDKLFYVQGAEIRQFSGSSRRTGYWKSAKLTFPAHAPMAWVQVDGDQSVDAPATVRWYGDGSLRHTAVFTNTLPQRLPAGRWLEHEVEVESKARLTKVMIAGSTQELQSA